MTALQWNFFSEFRTEFKTQCDIWNRKYSSVLAPLQCAASAADTPDYPLETGVVYNKALDDITQENDIRLIVIGDNPGKDEQLARNNRYLVGQSGKIAEGFFRRNPQLGTDFRKNVIILNKTPVHTAKTNHLRSLCKNGGKEVEQLILDSQLWMAQKTAELHQSLCSAAANKKETDSNNEQYAAALPELWLVGYAELKGKGIFLPYRDELKRMYETKNTPNNNTTASTNSNSTNQIMSAWNSVFVYQHFSMNRFLIDLTSFRTSHADMSLAESLHQLGAQHRTEIFI
jgi:hypothetical protein